jgi:hypothetical protein
MCNKLFKMEDSGGLIVMDLGLFLQVVWDMFEKV